MALFGRKKKEVAEEVATAKVEATKEESSTLDLIKEAMEEAKEEKLLENQELFKTPIVRNGKQAPLGYCPEIWKEWEKE